MAYAIHWKIKFRVLNSNQLLTVNIWKDGTLPSGYPLTLTGAQAPFSTQEDDNEDLFQPIRTQSGYLRIVDDGTALNSSNASVSFNWKDLLPSTDTDRPVTLTDSSNNILWQGFMQAQNFSGSLYGGTQVREFPVQCCLTVTQGKDINYSQTQIQNFAYLLKQIVDSIPNGFRPANFIIQGGTDARMWLMKKIDWQNFVSEDADGNPTAVYKCYQCLEDMCGFWGWTARTQGDTMYLMCIDDQAEQSLLTLTYTQLGTLAGGTSAGTTTSMNSVSPSGDIFASTEIDDFMNRGADKAVVNGNGNTADSDVIGYPPAVVEDALLYPGKYNIIVSPYVTPGPDDIQGSIDYEYYGDVGEDRWTATFSPNILQFPIKKIKSAFLEGSAVNGKASFTSVRTSMQTGTGITPGIEDVSCIRINKTYESGVVLASLNTIYEHSFKGGLLRLLGNVYVAGQKLNDVDSVGIGNKHMYIRLGIGTSRNNAMWYDGNNNWVSSPTSFKVNIGSNENIFYLNSNGTDNIRVNQSGRVFLDFLGSDDTDLVDGSYSGGGTEERRFFITDFALEYVHLRENSDARRRPSEMKNDAAANYVAKNSNNSNIEWNRDVIYVSMNLMKPGYGIIMNTDYTMAESVSYNSADERPEQHLANRVVNFWATAKRMIRADLWNSDSVVGAITPRHYVTIDGTRLHPFAIGHEWRDDVVTMSLLEIPT